jgi:hypothetical protein
MGNSSTTSDIFKNAFDALGRKPKKPLCVGVNVKSTIPAFAVMILGFVAFYLIIYSYSLSDSIFAFGFLETIAAVLFWHGQINEHVKALEKRIKKLEEKNG